MTVAERVAPSPEFVQQMDEANSALDQVNIKDLNWRLEVVPLGDTYIDADYQRPLDENWLKKREDDFKPWLLGCITVSERHRKGCRFATVDGQHRRELATREGVTHLPAVVFYELSKADEAALFSAFQMERRNITPLQRFNADLVAGEPRAKAINKMVNEEGFQFSWQVRPQHIKAVAAAEKIYENDPAMLRTILRLILASWRDLPMNTNERLLRGLSMFLANTPDFDESRFNDRLAQVTPGVLLDRALKLREGRGANGTLPSFVEEAITNQYRAKARR